MDTTDEQRLREAAQILSHATRVAVLTGAGISAESGVPTFRGEGGFWRGQSAMELATPEAFQRDPEGVWEFYRFRIAGLEDVVPNDGHRALADLEIRSDRFWLITQNVDGLHRAAVANGALSRAHKELIALGIGIASRCGGCITLHVQAAIAAGATSDEVLDAIGVAVLMGGGPASTYAIEALDALEHFSADGD